MKKTANEKISINPPCINIISYTSPGIYNQCILRLKRCSCQHYAGPVGNEPITQICESTETDRWNSILIKGKSAHRFNVDIYTQEDKYIPDVWIDRSECAVYVNFWHDWDKWCLYDSPDIFYKSIGYTFCN